MTPTVLWMRHGTSLDGLRRPRAHPHPGSPLCDRGAVEAAQTAHRLADHGWQPGVVVSSPLRRARQTAAIAGQILNAQATRSEDVLAEWRAPHCVLGLTPDQYPPEYLAWRKQRAQHPDTALPGGESLQTFAQRAFDATTTAQKLATAHGSALIISHKLLIGAVAAIHHGIRTAPDVFQHATGFRLPPARIWTPPEESA